MDEAQQKQRRFRAEDLRHFAHTLLTQAGVRDDIARDVADILLDSDLLGHTTHGLALLGPYLNEILNGQMAKAGEPRIEKRRPAAEVWDGGRLPGQYLTLRALERAVAMARDYGTGTVVIHHSHHIACLAAYLKRAADQGLVAIIECSDPSVAAVVPHGGLTPVMTPNPLAAGWPTSGDPVLMDVSMSITSMGYAKQQMVAGKQLPGPWLIDHQGNGTSDPGSIFNEPKGALLPLGGLDAGHKGFGLGLMIEAMTAGLGGHGRADPVVGWGGTTFIQVLDPEAFAGIKGFERQMDHLATLARASKPRAAGEPVRMPGERGMQRYRQQLAQGVALYPTILPSLSPWAKKYRVDAPLPLDD